MSILLLLTLWLSACSHQVLNEPAGVTRHSSDDLAIVRDLVIRLASELGADQVLVVFDLDNTLLAMTTELGADQWYDWQKQVQSTDRCDPRLVSDRLAVQGALYHVGSMRPTQPDGPRLIAEIQNAGLTTMVMTARGEGFRLPTFRELRRNGMNFRDSSPGQPGGYAEAYLPSGAQRAVRYEDGVYMLAGQHKGEMLLELLDRLAISPAAVVFVDDKLKNVDAVAGALERTGIRGEIVHYTREAARVAAFDESGVVEDWAEIGPALITVQRLMGDSNFKIPHALTPGGCP